MCNHPQAVGRSRGVELGDARSTVWLFSARSSKKHKALAEASIKLHQENIIKKLKEDGLGATAIAKEMGIDRNR